MTEKSLLRVIVAVADSAFDGHVTIMKFTTNWRIQFGSQHFYEDGEAWISKMPAGKTLQQAFLAAINEALTV